MTNGINNIISAIAALANALPGSGKHATVNLHGCDAAAIAAYVEAGGVLEVNSGDNREEEWDTVNFIFDEVRVTAFGEHRRRVVPSRVDEQAAKEAIAQAQAVLA